MRLREKPLNPWSIVNPNGVILASHCDCMAGLGEVCSHVAAMLFNTMEIVRIRDTQTVTQDPAYWKVPPSVKKVEYKEVRDIDFTSKKSLKRKFDRMLDSETTTETQGTKKPEKQIEIPTADEISKFLTALHGTGKKLAILSVTEPFADEYVPTVEKEAFPSFLSDLKDKDAITMNYGQLLTQTDRIEITVTEEEVNNVEAFTREQSKSKLWHDFRAGRITASKIKQVCSTDPDNPSQSLIMSVCYPDSRKIVTDATQWGIQNEKVACDKFVKKMSGEHVNLRVSDCGLYISRDTPFVAATPDGIVECDCCGKSILEVKCPYSQRKNKLDSQLKDFYLVSNEDEGLTLNRKHQYYFQIQAQLGVTKLDSAYFVVMTESDLHVEKVCFDKNMWVEMCASAEKFFRLAVLPELVGKFYSRLPGCGIPSRVLEETKDKENDRDTVSDDSEKTWCYCDQVESGRMISCDNENCKLIWFHFTCLKLDAAPKCAKWYCPDCRKLPEFKRKRKTTK